MKISDEGAKKGILGYLSTRCDVSSQHKLPTVEDILSTWTAETIGRVRTSSLVDELLQEGRLISYGPYISDHPIDVL
ncbi:hypothetical protein ACFPOD_05150 [Nitratireductor kimnyeongensis]|uniref:Uncharacterized protein n=1 Tax=Nitratireductor kimnyeongensis TaxID=430679 RepID=A0ABW0T6R0_9HYPH|nr:hypothetical protein [Nitratireductor kimnyeongensis]QZZ34530.1 hypothetical protein KW403_12050 [Nitratireductor kimnyeongensis]